MPVCSTDPCSNNGTCLQSVSGFTCACRGNFTGETCETRINDCQDVDCNNGTCVDGVLSFTCQCDPGFTGDFCEERIITPTLPDSAMTTPHDSPITALPDTTPPETPLPNSPIPGSTTSRNGGTVSLGGDNSGSNVGAGGSSGGSSNSVGAVAGAVVGSIVILIVTTAIVTILLILCIRRRKSSSKPKQGTSPFLRIPQNKINATELCH